MLTNACIKQDTKKYKSRKSPPYSAMNCRDKTVVGNDGASYASKPDKRGIYRWVIYKNKNKTIKTTSSKCVYKKTDYGSINVSKYLKCIPNDTLKSQLGMVKHIYEINDNAMFPYVVFDYGNGRMAIYNNHFNEEATILGIKLMDVKYERKFIGDNEINDTYWMFKRGVAKGNTILLQTGKGKYMFIGKGIISFSTKDDDIIRNFYSPIGGNYDSFAYAVGDKYVYLLNDKKYALIGEFDVKKDIIKQYNCYDGECKKYKTMRLPMKTVYAPFHGFY